jgi:hypothetical protein
MSKRAVLTIALAALLAQPVLARTYLNCSTRKVVIISAPSGDTSSRREEDLGFWVDGKNSHVRGQHTSDCHPTRQRPDQCGSRRHLLRVRSSRRHLNLRSLDNEGCRYDHNSRVGPMRDFGSSDAVKAVLRHVNKTPRHRGVAFC